MAGRGLPAMTGPAGHGGGQEAAGGAVVVEEGRGFVEGPEPAGGGLAALQGDPGRCRGGLVRCLGRVFGNEAAVGRGSVEIGRGMGWIGHGAGPGWR